MALQNFDKALLAELVVVRVVGFGDAVGVESEGIAWEKLAFSNFAIPILENPKHGGSGVEALNGVITVEQQAGEMDAIRVAQAADGIVIFGEEKGGERAVGSVVAEQLVHGTQEPLRLIESNGALAAQIGLQVGHQESGGDSFSGDVTDHEAEALLAEIEEVIIIATNFAGLDAKASIFKSFQGRLRLGEEPGLDLLSDFEFLGDTAIGFQPVSKGAALCFDGLGHFIEAHQRKGIAVKIPKTGKDPAPNGGVLCAGRRRVRRLRCAHVHLILEALQAGRELEANSPLGPFAVLGNHILGDKGDRHGPANELELFRAGVRRDEGEVRSAVGRGDGDRATAGLNAGVKDQLEPELFEVKVQALVEIANVNGDRLEAQVRVLAIQANGGAVSPLARGIGHGRDYKAECDSSVCNSRDDTEASGDSTKSVFGPAEFVESVLEAGEREADNVEVAAFDSRDEAASAALDGVGTSFVIGFAAGEIARDFFFGEGGEMDKCGLDEGELLDIGQADEGDACDDGMGAAGESFEHVACVIGRTRLAEDAAFEGDDGVGGDNNGRADSAGGYQLGLGSGEALDEVVRSFAGIGCFVDGGGEH